MFKGLHLEWHEALPLRYRRVGVLRYFFESTKQARRVWQTLAGPGLKTFRLPPLNSRRQFPWDSIPAVVFMCYESSQEAFLARRFIRPHRQPGALWSNRERFMVTARLLGEINFEIEMANSMLMNGKNAASPGNNIQKLRYLPRFRIGYWRYRKVLIGTNWMQGNRDRMVFLRYSCIYFSISKLEVETNLFMISLHHLQISENT